MDPTELFILLPTSVAGVDKKVYKKVYKGDVVRGLYLHLSTLGGSSARMLDH